MALLDENKLQGRIYEILELLRKQSSCCGFISAQFMKDNTGTTVFALVSPSGDVIVKTSPTGTVISNPNLPLQPL